MLSLTKYAVERIEKLMLLKFCVIFTSTSFPRFYLITSYIESIVEILWRYKENLVTDGSRYEMERDNLTTFLLLLSS